MIFSARFRQIDVVPAYQKVADAIEREILSGRIKPGEPIGSEEELVRQFRLNRSTVREGLRVLQESGYIRREAGRRLHASVPGSDKLASRVARALVLREVTFRELYDATVVLEIASIEAAIDNAKPSDLAQMRNNLEDAAKVISDPVAFVELDCAFHDLVSLASGNRVLHLSREPIVRLFFPATEIIVSHSNAAASQILEAHRELLGAVERKDKEAANTWTRRHLRAWRSGFEQVASLDEPVELIYSKYVASPPRTPYPKA